MKSEAACTAEFESLPSSEQHKVEAYRQIPLSSALAFYREFEDIKKSRIEDRDLLKQIAVNIKRDTDQSNERLLAAVKMTLEETQRSTLAMIELMSRRFEDHDRRIGQLEAARTEMRSQLQVIHDELDSIRETIGVGA